METVRACVLLLMQKRGASGLKRRLQWLQQQFIVMELSACTCPAGSKGDREKDFLNYFSLRASQLNSFWWPKDSLNGQVKTCRDYTEVQQLVCTFLPLPLIDLDNAWLVGWKCDLQGIRKRNLTVVP